MSIIYLGKRPVSPACPGHLSHVSSYLLKPYGVPWSEGIVALEAGKNRDMLAASAYS